MVTTKEVGDGGVRRAAALLGVAIGGEVSNATMDEDAAKVDLHVTFRNVFRKKELIPLRCQVKSGSSYGRKFGNQITLSIDGETREALSGTGTPGLIAWVPPSPADRVYWYASDPRHKRKTTVRVTSNDYLRPTLRFDVSRLAIYASWGTRHASQTVKILDETKILESAKQHYARLKQLNVINPLAGNLNISRLAWRHVTRRAKTKSQRNATLLVTGYLEKFLDKVPDRFLCRREAPVKSGRTMVETRYITCWYRDALVIGKYKHTLVIRIQETVRYPERWQSQAFTDADVQQQATLASWWHTPQL